MPPANIKGLKALVPGAAYRSGPFAGSAGWAHALAPSVCRAPADLHLPWRGVRDLGIPPKAWSEFRRVDTKPSCEKPLFRPRSLWVAELKPSIRAASLDRERILRFPVLLEPPSPRTPLGRGHSGKPFFPRPDPESQEPSRSRVPFLTRMPRPGNPLSINDLVLRSTNSERGREIILDKV